MAIVSAQPLLLIFLLLLPISIITSIGIGGTCGGIGIDKNGGCALPPAPPHPPPSPPPPLPTPSLIFDDVRLKIVYQVIQNFKKTIVSDPMGITKTWVGAKICSPKMYLGFYCANPPFNKSAKALAAVDFNGYKLGAPTINGFLDKLPDLAFFHANSNLFRGKIPPALFKLPYFYELDVSNNRLTGSFPFQVLTLKNLTFLDLRFNFFSGSVPYDLFLRSTFPRLEVLFVNNNNFMESLPSNLGQTPVKYLTLANNKFTGVIPRSIGQASKTLIEVLFLNNLLSGCLPYEIGLLTKATVFDAGYNQLTGPLPFSLACLEKMEQLNFAGNRLYGKIPEVVCKLEKLTNLSLSDNYFTMIGPMCRRLMLKRVLDVRKNCILGLPNQRPAEECTAFFSKPLNCPFHSSYYYLPCKKLEQEQQSYQEEKEEDVSVSGSVSVSTSPSPSPSPSPSYSALIQN